MVCSRALSRSALSQPCLRAPASALELARRGHVVVQRLHVVKALHCRRRAGPGRQHRLAVRVAALLTLPGLQAVELATKAVAVLGALPLKRRACWRGRGGDGAVAAIAQEHAQAAHGGVTAAEQSKSHCAAASSLCLDQPAAPVEPIDACR